MNRYVEFKQRQQKEFDAFPMVYAFSNKQFEEAMGKLGLKPSDTDKIYKFGCGGFYRKSDSKELVELINRHDAEFKNEIESDLTGDGFIYQMFEYELSNHEYCITWDIEPTLDALGLTKEDIEVNEKLAKALEKARLAQTN